MPQVMKSEYRNYKCGCCGHIQSIQTNHLNPVRVYCNGCSWKGAGFDKTNTNIPTKGQALGDNRRNFIHIG